jgi:deoxyribodipyrimidine photo-lyase
VIEATPAAAQARIAAVEPAAYARSRNHLDGAVSGLSPYITHGFVTPAQVLAGVQARHGPLYAQHRFVMELGWREYFRHVWQHRGAAILESLHDGVPPESAYARELPADIRQARTGVPAVDASVRALYATGLLHNHARLWLASYAVHLRKVHWRTGADWMVAHLLDGDLASNHLSWQWVAGTGSARPYLFNAENVARFAPAPWHSPGTVIDQPYEALDAIARSSQAVPAAPRGEGIEEPAPTTRPPPCDPPSAASVAGRDVWLMHPWALAEPPGDCAGGTIVVGLWPAAHHAAWPWSAARWSFVASRLRAATAACWHLDAPALGVALAPARSVRTWADPHVETLLPPLVQQRPRPRLFADVPQPCRSFSAWWARTALASGR